MEDGDAPDPPGEPLDHPDHPAHPEPHAGEAIEDPGALSGEAIEDPEAVGRDPRRFNEWRKRSATGVVMSGIALGLREALELPDQRPALVVEAPGDPADPDRPIDLHFDPDDPAATVAVVRHRDGGEAAGPDRAP